MAVSRWHMHRLGLVDFWCYDNDEFYFQDGHMLLRGSNGSGKSVTMQSFIPLLLDGNKSSERLDPFGTRSRKMETYLIDENSDRDERIGYLYLEFKREESDVYLTIGMGLRAIRNKPLDSWYFVIEDNRRVNIDFSLMDHQLTLSEKQLKNILGDQVFKGQTEYMQRVNNALFGFENLADYKDAIDLLLQLRSPKLSNSLAPRDLQKLLSSSLQPLSEDDLRPMSEAISNMDNLQDDLDNLATSLEAAGKISNAYTNYNKAILIDKWQKYQRENDFYNQIDKEIKTRQLELSKLHQDYEDTKATLSNHKVELEVSKNKKEMLIDSDIERLYNDMLALKKSISELEYTIENKEAQCESKEEKNIDVKKNIEYNENEVYQWQKKHQEAVTLLDEINQSFPFSEHSVLKENLQHFDFSYTKNCLKEELKKTQEVMQQMSYLDLLSEQIKRMEDEILQNDQKLQDIQVKLAKDRKSYDSVVREYQEYFYTFNTQNGVLKLSGDDLKKMSEELEEYEYSKDYQLVYNVVFQIYLQSLEDLIQQNGLLKIELHQLQEQLEIVNQEYRLLKDKKDIEPERDHLVKIQREYLNHHHMAFVPLYQLLDFGEEIDELSKNTIEEILSQMHLLDAIVMNQKYQAEIESLESLGHDYFLWTTSDIEDLKPVETHLPFNGETLKELLSKLGIDADGFVEIGNSYFKAGLLEGTIDKSQEACFIGFDQRRKAKEEKLNQLLQKINRISDLVEKSESKLKDNNEKTDLLKREMNSFKDETELKEKLAIVEMTIKDQTFVQNKLNELISQKTKEIATFNQTKNTIVEKCQYLMMDVSQNAVKQRIEDIHCYQDGLDQLKDALNQEKHYQELLAFEKNKYDELLNDIDLLKYEIMNAKETVEISLGKAETIQKELDAKGYQDKQQELAELELLITSLEKTIHEKTDMISKLEVKFEYINQELTQKIDQLETQKTERNIYSEIFQQELQYAFVASDEKEMKSLVLETKLNKTVSEYLAVLQSVFFEQVTYLASYHLTYEMAPLCHEKEDVSAHFTIKATNQGKKMPFLDLLIILQEQIESQKMLIMKADRAIFEDILVNTLGKKIRNRIQASKHWVEKMDRYMHDMNTSSGLQLSIRWKAKKAVDGDELDTQKLVELLEKDYRILKESDREKISQHFRSKIEAARKLSVEDNVTSSFHQMIRDVMDYREWFEFTLFAKKPNENKKELTNRVFYAYSGGEKAIAMYVPLFSAVAAKLESANEDAPHLIALDEAFAGVDENNIDNLFALITKFDFDYIMNSQALWGDYPSCKSLAIYELFRPNNAPFVTKVAYVWNGHTRRLVVK